MSLADRYHTIGRFAQHGRVTVDRALDPVTGLEVLVYRFPGESVADATGLDPAGFWAVLDAGTDAAGGYLVSNLVGGATPAVDQPQHVDDAAAARAFTLLAVAADAGVPHGDLGPHRLYGRGGQLWIEGYGVPWSDGDVAGDVRDLARGLLDLDGSSLSRPARAALERALDHGDAHRAADELGAVRPADAPADRPIDPAAATEAITVEPQPQRQRPPRNAAPEAFGQVLLEAAPESTHTGPEHPRPHLTPAPRHERPTSRPRPVAAAQRRTEATPKAAPVFSKAPPPDVRYRHAGEVPIGREDDEPELRSFATTPRDRRRVWALGILVVAAMILALLIVVGRPGSGRAGAPPAATGTYVVDVQVAPERHPPASLVVVASPSGSRHAAGTVLGSVPRRVVLDREGTWQLQGRFGDRRSSVVTLQVPRDGVVVLSFTEGSP